MTSLETALAWQTLRIRQQLAKPYSGPVTLRTREPRPVTEIPPLRMGQYAPCACGRLRRREALACLRCYRALRVDQARMRERRKAS